MLYTEKSILSNTGDKTHKTDIRDYRIPLPVLTRVRVPLSDEGVLMG